MKIRQFDHSLVLAAPAKGASARSPGLHMSDIYNDLFAQLEPERYGEKDGGPDVTKMELGLAFEEVLEPVLAARLFGERPPERLTKEGIAYSPDYIFYDDEDAILGEFKLTWYSSRGAPGDKKFDKWIVQMKSYLYHLGIRTARLYVLFVNGDYRPPTPQLLAWELQFSKKELDENWAMMLRHAKRRKLL